MISSYDLVAIVYLTSIQAYRRMRPDAPLGMAAPCILLIKLVAKKEMPVQMLHPLRVALIGDYNPSVIAHQAIPPALRLAALAGGVEVEPVWTHTASITGRDNEFAEFDGIWCVPAGPYANDAGAFAAIRFAREHGVPYLGTCAGFQYALIEYARAVCGIQTADHQETAPDAAQLVITRLACSLVEQTEELFLASSGIVRRAYGAERVTEGYHCNFGVNPEFEPLLLENGLQAVARDLAGNLRGVELATHPFFVATLFQHERRALRGEHSPIADAFVDAMASRTPAGCGVSHNTFTKSLP
jgi:CTP synthase (UTP-ammonia lyase)